ncbi:uncharacterized protein LOC144337604 [Macaca mulatta]
MAVTVSPIPSLVEASCGAGREPTLASRRGPVEERASDSRLLSSFQPRSQRALFQDRLRTVGWLLSMLFWGHLWCGTQDWNSGGGSYHLAMALSTPLTRRLLTSETCSHPLQAVISVVLNSCQEQRAVHSGSWDQSHRGTKAGGTKAGAGDLMNPLGFSALLALGRQERKCHLVAETLGSLVWPSPSSLQQCPQDSWAWVSSGLEFSERGCGLTSHPVTAPGGGSYMGLQLGGDMPAKCVGRLQPGKMGSRTVRL